MKNKKAGAGKVILIILWILTAIVILAGIYLYNFYVFKEFKICISDENIQDTKVPCIDNKYCINAVKSNLTDLNKLNELPEFFKEKANDLFEKAVFCEQTCKFKQVKGEPFTEKVDNCKPNEQEILIKIRGKEGLQLLRFMQENKGRIGK